ncbi:MAG: hypothetical protein GY865_03230 [candidate division Zixibacteria bacterium]|nr:hypothetical protein [candidate division Zixibacteria bacterium]
MEKGYFLYLYAISLGIVSYLICLSIGIKFNNLKKFFFEGNSVLKAMSSIVGSIVSATILLTGLAFGYAMYGFIAVPFFIIPGITGLLLFLRKRAIVVMATSGEIGSEGAAMEEEDAVVNVFCSPKFCSKPDLYCWLSLLYLFMLAIVEISILKAGAEILFPGDLWAIASVYIIVIIAALYVYVGGFKGVLVTDVVQLILMAVAASFIISEISFKGAGNYIINHLIAADFITTIIAVFGYGIAALTFGGSAPELWKRVITLKSKKKINCSSWFSAPLVIIAGFFPVLIMIMSDIDPNIVSSLEDTFIIWKNILSNNVALFSASFIILLVTAVFTTIDTQSITIGQLLRILGKMNKPLSKMLFSSIDVRKWMVLSMIVALAIGVRINLEICMYIGAYAISLTIPLFILTHIEHKFSLANGLSIPKKAYIIAIVLSLFAIFPVYIFSQSGTPKLEYIFLGMSMTNLICVGGIAYFRRERKIDEV